MAVQVAVSIRRVGIHSEVVYPKTIEEIWAALESASETNEFALRAIRFDQLRTNGGEWQTLAYRSFSDGSAPFDGSQNCRKRLENWMPPEDEVEFVPICHASDWENGTVAQKLLWHSAVWQ